MLQWRCSCIASAGVMRSRTLRCRMAREARHCTFRYGAVLVVHQEIRDVVTTSACLRDTKVAVRRVGIAPGRWCWFEQAPLFTHSHVRTYHTVTSWSSFSVLASSRRSRPSGRRTGLGRGRWARWRCAVGTCCRCVVLRTSSGCCSTRHVCAHTHGTHSAACIVQYCIRRRALHRLTPFSRRCRAHGS